MSGSKRVNGAESILWDLSDLYPSADSPQFQTDKQQVTALADAFSLKYRGKIGTLSASDFAECLKAYEEISELLGRLGSFTYLTWSTNTENTAYGKLLAEITEFSSTISQKLVFFSTEWMALDENRASTLIASSELAFWKHYLEASRRFKPHTLEEKQEQILTAKSTTGRQAWVRFFDETLGAARFELDGEQLTEQEVLSKLHETDRDLRRRASESLTKGFKDLSRTLTFVFNTILADKATNDKLRGYSSWISSKNLGNEIADETVEILVNAVKERYPLVQRYYKLKASLLGIESFTEYDRYAPLLESETAISWDEAKAMVLDSYTNFHPEMGAIAKRFFDEKWIDAAIRPGKRGGAYSASTVTSVHPYVFMNYDGKIRDVQTLAHELGHGVHQYLSRQQGPLQSDTPLTTAETASVFGEMLVFQSLMSTISDSKEQLAMLMGKIDDTIATVFRQVSMNRFEHAIHTARREQGELSTEEFSALWRQTQIELYGDAVKLSPNYDLWWCYIPHFLHTPGYVYAYAFGELLVLALYEKFKQQPDGFADNYLDVLRAGGSDWPEAIIAKLGVDITDPQFWNFGLNVIERMIEHAEQLATKIG